MEYRTPVASVLIQRELRGKDNIRDIARGAVEKNERGFVPAFEFSHPEFTINGRVDHAVDDQGALSMASIDIYNPPGEVMMDLAEEGRVQVVAGYAEGGEAAPAVIFNGVLDLAYGYKEGTDRIWKIQAVAAPFDIASAHVRFSTPKGEEVSVHDVLAALLQAAGYNAETSSAAKAVKLVDYAVGAHPVEVEVQKLVEILAKRSKAPHLAAVDPYNPLNYLVLDLTKREKRGIIELDVDSDSIYSATPVLVRADADAQVGPGEGLFLVDYKFESALDPRLRLGMTAEVKGGGLREPGLIQAITSISHKIGGKTWTTTARGPFQGGGIY